MWNILLLCLILRGFLVSSELKYEISEVYMADTERYQPYTEPHDESRWQNYKVDYLYLGLLFAGKSEFSWIVELRVHGSDQELRSAGNLISSEWVLTTCRAKAYLEKAWDATRPELRTEVGQALAIFCQLYLWEFRESKIELAYKGNTWRFGGSRYISQSVAHPECDLRNMKNDMALLRLQTKIDIAYPYIGYMPARMVPNNPHQYQNFPIDDAEKFRQICYVASIGRSYWNTVSLQHLVVDFKVKYRVYYEELANCTNLVRRLCDSQQYNCEDAFRQPSVKGREWNCMRTRARVGTVCDHDRGAPVVCDDEVIGIVAFGALLKYCNNRIPMPFVVLKLHSYSDWAHGTALRPRNEPWDRP